MGTAVGEGLVMAADLAVARKAPLIVFSASGGARMQEGILSLMQLTRTTIAVRKVKEAGLPYIVVLTDPTTGGVSASFAMLGDVHHRRARRHHRLRRSARDPGHRSARNCRRASSARSTCSSTAWSMPSCTATSCARR